MYNDKNEVVVPKLSCYLLFLFFFSFYTFYLTFVRALEALDLFRYVGWLLNFVAFMLQ